MAKKRIFILGAGLAGLSAAWHLQGQGIECQILEKEPDIGGLCRSKNINGFTFDCDGHLLHFKHRYTFELVKTLLGGNLVEHERSSWIYSCGRYTRYPFQANLYGMPAAIIKECLLGLLKASKNAGLKKKGKMVFLEWINRTFGKGIARHFMIPYNKKFWTVSPQEMVCDWLEGFIPVPSLSQIIEGTIEESKRQFGYNAHFWYPKEGGINQLPLALAAGVKNIHSASAVLGIDLDKKELRTSCGSREKFDFLVSTIPLPEMRHLIKGLPKKMQHNFGMLRWNSIFNLNLGLKKKNYSGMHWAYFPQDDLCFFRVGFFDNFSSSLVPAGRGSLYAEVSYSKNKPIDKSRIVSRIGEGLKRAGILDGREKICVQDINEIEYGYPIYDLHYHQARGAVTKYLNDHKVIPCGRYGSWRYFSMEDAILDGRRAAELFYKND